MKMMNLLVLVITIASSIYAQEICRYSEVSIVLDASGSIISSEWTKAKQFAQTLVEQIGVSEAGNRIAVATFADYGKENIQCNKGATMDSLKNDISALQQFGDLTNIEDGLRKGWELLYKPDCNQRATQPSSRVIILMTDGEANRGGPNGYADLIKISTDIRNQGILIYAIGVGAANIAQLEEITGNPSHVIKAKDFNELVSLDSVQLLTAGICTKPQITTPKPETTTTSTEATTTTTPEKPTTTTTEETTTTTESTTTTPEMPTTTTTESTTTTPEMPTTTTTESTTTVTTETTPTPSDTCNCHIETELYPCIKWTKFEIIRKFDGKCYVDKLKLAIKFLKQRLIDLLAKINVFDTCKADLKIKMTLHHNLQQNYTLLFSRYDECTVNIVCKLQRWRMQLVNKLSMLEKELKIEEAGWGDFNLPNAWDIISKMMKKTMK